MPLINTLNSVFLKVNFKDSIFNHLYLENQTNLLKISFIDISFIDVMLHYSDHYCKLKAGFTFRGECYIVIHLE